VVVLAVLLPSSAWCIPHLEISCANRNHSKTGAITHNSNRGNSSRHNNSSSTVLLHHHCSRLPLGHHNTFLPVTFPAITVGRWGTLLESAASPSKATHLELRHPWSISRGTIRRVLPHGLAAPTIPLWRRFPRRRSSSSMSILLLSCLILEHHMTL
jgi:hypothetical protein